MKITILGSGTAVPSLDRNSSGVLLKHNHFNWVFDFGYGNLHQLLRLGVSYHDIDRIFFTHNHPDHMCDLIPFLFGARYQEDPRKKDLTIVGGSGFKEFFDGLMQAFKHWLIPTDYTLNIIEMDEEVCEFDGLRVETRKVRHIEMSRGFRVSSPQGTSFALSGDTDYCQSMVELAQNVDLMILECSFPDNMKVGGHLVPRLCGRLGAEACCQTLCLTHFYPPCSPTEIERVCRKEFKGNLVLAEDLTTFDLSKDT
tara:strand:- start:2603 stop:3367 length:765 start_codon:yes stop_codon:yes gene_type:complete